MGLYQFDINSRVVLSVAKLLQNYAAFLRQTHQQTPVLEPRKHLWNTLQEINSCKARLRTVTG